jgi:3-phenylpropionate/trans-cinnamate dioxygenase ferredoxin component
MLGKHFATLFARRSGLPFVPVARIAEVPASGALRVKVGDLAIGLYRIGDGIHAMEDACPHAGFALSKGRFENGVVVCSAHGLRYDVRTGFDPDHADGFPIPCFRVRIANAMVEVDLEDQINDPRRRRAPRRA